MKKCASVVLFSALTFVASVIPSFACEWWCGLPGTCTHCYQDVCVDVQCSQAVESAYAASMSEDEFLASLAVSGKAVENYITAE